jgi:putative transposase
MQSSLGKNSTSNWIELTRTLHDRYALTVCRYIELNPVRATIAALPEEYRWSSAHTHLGKARDPLITPHPVYQALGATAGKQAIAYRMWSQLS